MPPRDSAGPQVVRGVEFGHAAVRAVDRQPGVLLPCRELSEKSGMKNGSRAKEKASAPTPARAAPVSRAVRSSGSLLPGTVGRAPWAGLRGRLVAWLPAGPGQEFWAWPLVAGSAKLTGHSRNTGFAYLFCPVGAEGWVPGRVSCLFWREQQACSPDAVRKGERMGILPYGGLPAGSPTIYTVQHISQEPAGVRHLSPVSAQSR